MRPLLLFLLGLAALSPLGACSSHKPKSTAHMYSGDAPTIKFSRQPENAGGNLNTY